MTSPYDTGKLYDLGVYERVYACDNCGHLQAHDPEGRCLFVPGSTYFAVRAAPYGGGVFEYTWAGIRRRFQKDAPWALPLVQA